MYGLALLNLVSLTSIRHQTLVAVEGKVVVVLSNLVTAARRSIAATKGTHKGVVDISQAKADGAEVLALADEVEAIAQGGQSKTTSVMLG
jgi:hypothetical protein